LLIWIGSWIGVRVYIIIKWKAQYFNKFKYLKQF
jgi:hypothetical protein